MQSGPFKTHPLLSILSNTNKWCLSIKEGRVDCETIQQAFKKACMTNDDENLGRLLTFDYQPLLELKPTDPYYLPENPLKKLSLFLDALHTANYFSHQKISLLILKRIQSWTCKQLASEGSVFTKSISDAISAMALYAPAKAKERLEKELNDSFRLTRAQFDQNEYRSLLQALEDLACTPDYFEYAANQLLHLAAREVKLGVYHGHYKAIHHLTDLFRNSCSRVGVSLEVRLRYLQQEVEKADQQKSYSRLYALMKVLGTAANVFESGEHRYVEDLYLDKYIHGAIELLMRYAGRNDEDGLCSTAEEELHELLKITADETNIWGASDVPFLILRLYLESKREWDINPIYTLNNLAEFIDYLKKDDDNDEEMIHELERRLEQLASLFADRAFLAEDFRLFLSSKTNRKLCDIGLEVDPNSSLELHARQSLAERLVFAGKTNLHDIERGYPKSTYVVANFGLIVSDIPHESGGRHRRMFKSIPIKVPGFGVTGRLHQYGGHAEEALYEYLLKDENLTYYLQEFKKQYGIDSADHKVYGIVLDLHGTYDMCQSCSEKGEQFQNAFREKCLANFPKHQFKTIRKTPSQLPVIIRYSSDLRYDYANSDDKKKKGVLTLVSKEGAKRDLGQLTTPAFDYHRDIKQFGANLLLHGKSNWHSLWSRNQREAHSGKPLRLESWSAFSSDSQFNNLSDQQRRTNYTRLGQVETTKDEDLPDIKKLSLQ